MSNIYLRFGKDEVYIGHVESIRTAAGKCSLAPFVMSFIEDLVDDMEYSGDRERPLYVQLRDN